MSGNPYSHDTPAECDAHDEWEADERERRQRFLPRDTELSRGKEAIRMLLPYAYSDENSGVWSGENLEKVRRAIAAGRAVLDGKEKS